MIVFPAIDLRNGQCVRLTRGDFASARIYERDPVLQAQRFAAAGADWLHIVDLDGAQDEQSRQLDVIQEIAKRALLRLQVGGGIREASAVEQLLDCGIERVVIGSLAAREPERVKDWLRHFGPARIVLAFDVGLNDAGEPLVFTSGWQRESGQTLWDLLPLYADQGLQTILCTDIGRDGTLSGPNRALYQAIRRRWPSLDVLASGGIRDSDDLDDLASLGLAGAIVGKALYEGRIELTEATWRVKHAR
ncbi:MAG TPA: 1-(5-phosphoribosyl)-5-[(5-phosphoribosylamino)methylideneamino]imidazole-4-carboxamide isomerase [Rhizomicrobium sp.]|nr:1-(5-phosphoribosyl)-5-[(5-phosphoribosylamino)methylideneamino]imidazole-4-carboxamide isomerase [Rhizomicrobium sp.]